jgi:hypothetical protein
VMAVVRQRERPRRARSNRAQIRRAHIPMVVDHHLTLMEFGLS